MVKPWRIPRMWEDRTVAVLAGGPSMSQAVADQVRATGLPAIAINNSWRLAPWADLLYAADAAWWRVNNESSQWFAGLKVSCEPFHGALTLRNAGTLGWSDDQDVVHTYGNSGAQAIQIAAKAGASRILLCGFDMHARGGSHWHGDHAHPLRNTVPEIFAKWVGQMRTLAKHLADRGVEVLNCTPGSALDCWPFVTLEDALAKSPMPVA